MQVTPSQASQRRPSQSRSGTASTATPSSSRALHEGAFIQQQPLPSIQTTYPHVTSPGLPPTEPLLRRSPPSQNSSVEMASTRATTPGFTPPANTPSNSRSALNMFMAQESGQYGPYSVSCCNLLFLTSPLGMKSADFRTWFISSVRLCVYNSFLFSRMWQRISN